MTLFVQNRPFVFINIVGSSAIFAFFLVKAILGSFAHILTLFSARNTPYSCSAGDNSFALAALSIRFPLAGPPLRTFSESPNGVVK